MSDIFDTLDAPETTQQRDIFDDLEVQSEPTQEPQFIVGSSTPISIIPEQPSRTPEELTQREFSTRAERGVPVYQTPPPSQALADTVVPDFFNALTAEHKPTDTIPSAIAKGVYNVGLGLPRFATSPIGVASMIAGTAAPRLVTAAFAGDMLQNSIKSFKDLGEQWEKLSPSQRAGTLTELVLGTAMGLGLAKKTVTGFQKHPLGWNNATQRKSVEFLTELAQKQPEKFNGMVKDAITKTVDITQRTPEGVTLVTPESRQPEKAPVVSPVEPSAPSAVSEQLAAAAEKPATAAEAVATKVAETMEAGRAAPEAASAEAQARAQGAIVQADKVIEEASSTLPTATQAAGGVNPPTAPEVAPKPIVETPQPIVEAAKPTVEQPTIGEQNATLGKESRPLSTVEAIDNLRQRFSEDEIRSAFRIYHRIRFGQEVDALKPRVAGTSLALFAKEYANGNEIALNAFEQVKKSAPNEIQVTPTGGSIVEQKQPVIQETAVEAQAGTTQRQGAGETRPAQGEVLLEPKVSSGPVSFTDKSVRDHSQQAVIKGDTITINAKVGGKKAASYTIPLSEWIAADKRPTANPNWNRAQLVEKYSEKLGLDEQSGGPEQAQRIRDSQVRAIKGALSKQQTQPNIGPGAAGVGQVGIDKTQIEQLTDAFANKAPTRERAEALVRNSFDFASRKAAAKDAVSRAIDQLKATGDSIWTALTKFDKPDDLLKAKGDFSAEIESRGWRLRQFSKAVKKAVPDARRRNAIAKWIDAGGDDAMLSTGEAATKPEYKQAYRDARNLTPDEKTYAQNISNYFDARLQEAIDAGVLEHGLTDYIHRIYERDPNMRTRALAYVQSGILSKNPSLAKKRLFEFDWQAEQLGYRPVQDFLTRVSAYEASLGKAIAARKMVQKLTTMTAPDGRPVIGIKGLGIPIEDATTGERKGTIIRPQGDFSKATDPTDPINYRGDYKDKEYPSLSRWKWVGEDSAGKPIFVQGDVAIHPDFVGRMEALLEPSHVRYGRYPKVGKALLDFSSAVKQTMLDISMFHQVQIAVHAAEHKVMPWKITEEINLNDPKVEGLLKGGITLGGDFAPMHKEGLIGSSLTRHVPILGPVMETYHSWLFQDFIPRVKMSMALHALERNRQRYAKDLASGRMSEYDLNYLTAKQANAAFGELNYTMLERSKTTQDMLRLVMLAPDFLEARARFAAQAFQVGGEMQKIKGIPIPFSGNEQRAALLLGALTMYVTARMLNKFINDQYHFEPENLFSVVYDKNKYSLRTVQGDILHLLDKPVQFWMSRLNPVYGRTFLEMATGRDYFGRKRTAIEQMGDFVSTAVPISLRTSKERKMWESFLNGIGVNAKRYNDVDDAFKLAREWKDKNGIQQRGEFIYDANKDPLRNLKIALSRGNDGDAVKAIKDLLDSKAYTVAKLNDYFDRYASMPFAGSKANDAKFIKSLKEDDRKTIEAARQHKLAIRQLYRNARNQYLTALRTPPTQQ